MTDLEKFIDLYKGFGIPLEPKREVYDGKETIEIRMEQGNHPKFVGYYGFLSIVTFSPDGQFVDQGFWE